MIEKIGIIFFIWGISASLCFIKARQFVHPSRSLPVYYGGLGLLSTMLMSLLCILFAWFFLKQSDYYFLFILGGNLIASLMSWFKIKPSFHAQYYVELSIKILLGSAAFISLMVTFAIILTLFFETIHFFNIISIKDFLFGTQWHPRTTYMPTVSSPEAYGLYGALPLFSGTLLIMTIAMVISAPLGLFVAIYLREYANPVLRRYLKPIIEILAGIPTIVYGFFALVAILPLLQNISDWIRIEISPQSALGAGIIMGMMILPYISSLSEEALGTVPQNLRDNSLALGATQSETIKRVVIPGALPGIISALLLAMSRAIGETMLVVMAAGLTPQLTFNPLKSVTTVTVQIVSLLTGDQEFDSPKTLSAFALGMTLFLITLFLNSISLRIIRKHREKYDVVS